MILNKYLLALIQFVLTVATALQAAVAGGFDTTEKWQLALLVITTAGAIFTPLLKDGPAWLAKGLVSIVGAIIIAVIPFVTDGWTDESWIIVTVAALNALAAYVGVAVRIDSARRALADDNVDSSVIQAVDPAAVQAAYRLAS